MFIIFSQIKTGMLHIQCCEKKYLLPLNFLTFCHILGFKDTDITFGFVVMNQHQEGDNGEVEQHLLDI